MPSTAKAIESVVLHKKEPCETAIEYGLNILDLIIDIRFSKTLGINPSKIFGGLQT